MAIDNSANIWGKSPTKGYVEERYALETFTCAACGVTTRTPWLAKDAAGYYFCSGSCAMGGPYNDKPLRRRRPSDSEPYRWPPADAEKNKSRVSPMDQRTRDELVERVRKKLEKALDEPKPVEPPKAPKKKPEPKTENPIAARMGQLDFDDDD